MRLPEALEAWASHNRDHLSLDTLGEVDIISRRIERSALATQTTHGLTPADLNVMDGLFDEERAKRARLLLDVVASWSNETQTATAPTPTRIAPTPPGGQTLPGVAAPPAPRTGTPVSPPRPSSPPRGSSAAASPPRSLPSPSFLGSETLDEQDAASFFGPTSRSSGTSGLAKGLLGALVVVGLLATAALLITLFGGSDDNPTIGTVATEETTAVAVPESVDPEPVASDESPTIGEDVATEATTAPTNEASPAATDTSTPAATAPISTAWADTTTVLNSGTVDVLASTYNVSPANRAVLIGHTAAITGIAVSDDGRVLTAGADRRLVDWGSDVTIASPDVLDVDATLTALTRTQDQRLVAGDGLGNVTIIDLAQGGNPVIIPVYAVAVSTVAEVAVGVLAVGSVDGDVSVFQIDDADAKLFLPHPTEVTAIDVLDDGRIVTVSVDAMLRLWQQGATTPEVELPLGSAATTMTALSGNRIAIATIDGQILVSDVGGTAIAMTMDAGHQGPVRGLIQVDESTLASGGDDTTVRLWDLATGSQQRVLDGHGDLISALAMLPDGRLVSTSADGTGRVWDLTIPAETPVAPPHVFNVADIASWANDQLVSGGDDGRVMLISTSVTSPPTLITQHGAPIVGVEVMPNRDIVSVDALSSLRVSEAAGDGVPLYETTIAPGATALASVGSDGVVTGHADGTVRFTDFSSEVAVVNAHGSGVNDVLTLSSGLVVSAGQDRTVRVIDLQGDIERLPVFDLHTAPVDVVAELADGRVASAGSDGIYIWSTSELSRDHIRLDGHRSTITSLVGLPGNRLLSTAHDGRVRLWNLDDPEAPPTTLLDVPGIVNPVLAQAGNSLFVTGAARGYVTFAYEG